MRRPRLHPVGQLRGASPWTALTAVSRARRRLILFSVGVVASVLAVVLAVVSIAVVSSPAAVPVAITGTVLSKVADLFGSGEGGDSLSGTQLSAAGEGEPVTCRPVAPAAPVPDQPAPPAEEATVPAAPTDPDAAPPPAVTPIAIGADGSLDRADASTLIDPVPAGTSALRGQVWFLYRLAGLGDWDAFTAAYLGAGLHDDDESENAPLLQVQALNSTGVDVERYRLTAAALTAAGEHTGRLEDPYPDYREIVATELISSCLDDADATDARMVLPPASTVVPAATPAPEAGEPAVPEAPADANAAVAPSDSTG